MPSLERSERHFSASWGAGWGRVKWLRRLAIASIAMVIVLTCAAIDPSAQAQLPSLTAPAKTQSPPIGVERRGTLEATAVHLDGQELFKIASPSVFDRREPGSQIPVEARAKQVEANLAQLVKNGALPDQARLDPKTIQIAVARLEGQPVLLVKDPDLAEAKVLLTVTNTDAQFHSTSEDRLANRWQEILQTEVRQALELRQPEVSSQRPRILFKIVAIALLLTLLLWVIWALLRRRSQQLERQQAAEIAAARIELPGTPATEEEPRSRLFPDLLQFFGVQQRLQVVRFLQWLLFWAIACVWMVGLAASLSIFPQTRQFADRVVTIPVVILAIWFLTGLVNRLTDFGIDRFIQNREQDQSLTAANLQRINTVTNVIKGLKMVLLYTIGFLWVLQWLKLASESLLLLGGLLALALSFAAQNLVKDFVNGFLILLEDQFRIGDHIKTNAVSGCVENLNLRITQIRSDDGNLITLPNSLISKVENMSRTWARADFRVEVAYQTNVDRALTVVRETVDRMARDPEWKTAILDTQELFGVEQISHTGIVIRIWIKTAPLKQGMTARELRRRLKIAFDRHNIQIGIPQQMLLDNSVDRANSIEHSPAIEEDSN